MAAKPQGCSGLSITPDLFAQISKDPEKLFGLRPRQFEELTAESLASHGWRVGLTSATRDGGYDILGISKNPTERWLIECKRYSQGRKVGIGDVRALYGARVLGVPSDMLMLVTTSHFSKVALDLKKSRCDLQLKDYEAVLEWINSYRPNPTGCLYLKNSQLVLSGAGSVELESSRAHYGSLQRQTLSAPRSDSSEWARLGEPLQR